MSRKLNSASSVYVRACLRCGCTPVPEIARNLSEQGAIVVDLRLCHSRSLAAVCATLRDVPSGITQVVFRDGQHFSKTDAAYQKNAAARRQRGDGALDIASLRLLMTALTVFLAAQGCNLEVLDLAGVPLGSELTSLLAPLAAALLDCRTVQLRCLNLTRCRLGDRGLALLLPWLAGIHNHIPRLQALVLAGNRFADNRLVEALLRARARLCYEHRAAPLCLLDLSGNPELVSTTHTVSSKRGRNVKSANHRQHGSGGNSTALAKSLACAMAEGLPLQVLRLQHLKLTDQALAPLLRLFQAEARRSIGSCGSLATASGFCLEELDVSFNPLTSELEMALLDSLQLLSTIRSKDSYLDGPAPSANEVPNSHGLTSHNTPAPSPPCLAPSSSRAQSEPGSTLEGRRFDVLERDTISEGGGVGDEGEDELVELGLAARPTSLSREAFILRRAQDQWKFRRAATELARRRPRRLPLAVPAVDLGVNEYRQISIASGPAGPRGSQLVVRQAILEMLQNPPDGSDPKCSSGSEQKLFAFANDSLPAKVEATLRSMETGLFTRHTVAPQQERMWQEADRCIAPELRPNLRDTVESALAEVLGTRSTAAQDARLWQAANRPAAVTAKCWPGLSQEEHLFQAERLEGLRAAFLDNGAKPRSHDSCKEFASLDDLHREAMEDLCGSILGATAQLGKSSA